MIPAVQDFIRLTREKRAVEAELRRIKDALAPLETELVDEFVRQGVQNTTVHGMTLYLSVKPYARTKGDANAAIDALREAGFADCVSLGVGKVSALFRDDELELPPAVVAAFEVYEKVSINAKESPK